MSREQSTQTFNSAQEKQKQDQANAQTLFNQNQGQFATTQNAVNAQYANPGYDPATKTDITSSGQNANNAAFDAMQSEATDRATRTRNDASTSSLLDNLSRKHAEGSSDAAMKAQTQIGNASLDDKQRAIANMSGLYGEGTAPYSSSLGASNAALGTGQQAAAANPSFGDTFGTAFAGALGSGLVPKAKIGPLGFG